jgi:hypothetical protein
MVVTALRFKISSGLFSKFRAAVAHLPQSWLMDQLSAGAIQTKAVIARQFVISSSICSYAYGSTILIPQIWIIE